MSLTQPLRRATQQRGDALAIMCGERATTFDALEAYAGQCGAVLRNSGIGPGDCVGLIAGQGDRLAAMMYGVWWAGGAAAPISPHWDAESASVALAECDARLVLVDAEGAALGGKLAQGRPERLRLLRADALEAEMDKAEPMDDACVGGEALAVIYYDVCEAGQAKGVPLTHANLYTNVLSWLAEGEISEGARSLIGWPLSHPTGLAWFLAQMQVGGLSILPSDRDPATWPVLASRRHATHVLLSTQALQVALTQRAEPTAGLSRLEAIVYGGAPMSEPLLARAMKLAPGARFIKTYSTIEAGPAALVLSAWHHSREGRAAGKLRSAGRAGMNCEVRVVDNNGDAAPPFACGLLQVRGAGVATRYAKAHGSGPGARAGEWLATGDRAWLDEDGYVYMPECPADDATTSTNSATPRPQPAFRPATRL